MLQFYIWIGLFMESTGNWEEAHQIEHKMIAGHLFLL